MPILLARLLEAAALFSRAVALVCLPMAARTAVVVLVLVVVVGLRFLSEESAVPAPTHGTHTFQLLTLVTLETQARSLSTILREVWRGDTGPLERSHFFFKIRIFVCGQVFIVFFFLHSIYVCVCLSKTNAAAS